MKKLMLSSLIILGLLTGCKKDDVNPTDCTTGVVISRDSTIQGHYIRDINGNIIGIEREYVDYYMDVKNNCSGNIKFIGGYSQGYDPAPEWFNLKVGDTYRDSIPW